MRILLVSTYELGRQPVHLASPTAALRAAGHEVLTRDLAVEELTDDLVTWADRVAISVPMHTATRMADQLARAIGEAPSRPPVALFGLYAGVGSAEVDARLEGEYEPGLLAWAEGEDVGTVRHLGRSKFALPERADLPPLSEYARLEYDGVTRLAGAVETSHGCRHRCRHCPIPAVYDGRIRVVPADQVLADVSNLVAAGAGHITFGDADFLNAPPHSMDILEKAHRAHPDITFDVTIKVEHLIRHHELLPSMSAANVLFIVSAFESVDDPTLEILDKGHTVADMSRAIELTRAAGIHIRPTWLPFMPWTTPGDVADIFDFLEDNDLVGATDPVQMAIRLLIPKGSLLEDHPAITPHLGSYDESALSWQWGFADADTEVLHKELETIAADATECARDTAVTLEEMRETVARISGRTLQGFGPSLPVPRLTESWYCCAEPTETQAVSVRLGRR